MLKPAPLIFNEKKEPEKAKYFQKYKLLKYQKL